MPTQSEITNIYGENLPEINISNFTCQQLLANLQKNISKPRPSSIIFKMFGNVKSQLDEIHQRYIISQIHNLREIQHEAVNLQAEAVFSREMIIMLVSGMRAEAEIVATKNALRLLQLKQEIDIAPIIHDDRKDQIEHMQKMRRLEREKEEIEVAKSQEELYSKSILNKKEEYIVSIIEKILETIDYENLSEELVFLVINSQLNPNGVEYTQDFIKQKISSFIIKQEELKTKQEEVKTNVVKEKGETIIFDVREARNTNRGR